MKPTKVSREHLTDLEIISRNIVGANIGNNYSFSVELRDSETDHTFKFWVELIYYQGGIDYPAIYSANVYIYGWGIHNKKLGGFGFQV